MLVWQFGPAVRANSTSHARQFKLKVHIGVERSVVSYENIDTTQRLTGEAHAAGANISAGHVLAGASVHTRVGFTLVVVDVAVFTAPAGVTQAFIADGEKMVENFSVKSESSS